MRNISIQALALALAVTGATSRGAGQTGTDELSFKRLRNNLRVASEDYLSRRSVFMFSGDGEMSRPLWMTAILC